MIAAVNEKYGTSFTSYTPVEVFGLDVGDDYPDWDAYEKILIQLEDGLYKFDLTDGHEGAFCCMEVQNGSVSVYASSLESGGNINVYNPNGTFNAASGSENVLSAIAQICSNYPNFVSVSRIVKDSANLENWSEYSLLS